MTRVLVAQCTNHFHPPLISNKIFLKMVKVNQKKCIGCGSCESVCPAGFQVVEGKSIVKNQKAPCAEEAIQVCPVGAISHQKEKNKNLKGKSEKASSTPKT